MHITSRNLLAGMSILALTTFAAIPAAASLQPPETTPTTAPEGEEQGEIVTAEDVTKWTAEDHAAAQQPPKDTAFVTPVLTEADGGGAGGGGAAPATAAAETTPETAPLGSSGTGGTGGNGRPVQDPDKPQ